MECFSNDMEVVLGTYKKVGGQAERMINPGYQRERVSGHAGVKDRCQFAGGSVILWSGRLKEDGLAWSRGGASA